MSLRTSFEPSEPQPPADGGVTVGPGPRTAYASPAGLGCTGRFAARFAWDAPGAHEGVLLDGPFPVTGDSRLSYCILPEDGPAGDRDATTFVSLDLVLDDGSRLSTLHPLDVHGIALTPTAQGEARILLPRQWNLVECDLPAALAGRVVTSVVVRADARTAGTVWIDDVSLAPRPVVPTDPVDLVDTRRGSNSGFTFSRGNTFPATALPNAAVFLSPATRRSLDWFYCWADHNTPSGYPALEGLVLTHQPSPWMADRNQLLITPTWGAADSGPHTFRHDNEDAGPHRYAVRLDGGLLVEAAPSSHGAAVRLTPPAGDGVLTVTLDVVDGELDLRRSGDIWVGWLENGSRRSIGTTRQYFALSFDRPVRHDGTRFLATDGGPITLRIATSLLGVDQAAHHLATGLGDTLDDLAVTARAAWAERLAVLELDGATHDECVSAYSNLYRLNLYPNFTSETGPDGVARYASPVLPHAGPSDDEHTGAVVVEDEMSVNHGFWDTYRTAWPAYALWYPDLAARLADGFVEQYRTGGWIARWSSPGYADVMTGTSSDVAFADLDAKSIPLADRRGTYLSGLRNATARPTEAGVGRKDLRYVYLGGPTPECHEPVSWTFEGALNDHALGLMASRLLADETDPAAARRLRDEARYLLVRSAGYSALYDASTGFFQSRNEDGSFRFGAAEYDPRVWGYDYTEANGWTFGFPAPHDPSGLAGLVGGRAGLLARLDEFFSTVEDGDLNGSYHADMHEIIEAAHTRAGQFDVSNQPAHHIPFLYGFTDQPWKTGVVTRDALRRLFRGSALGQGYPGDEDNGEMSAWYLFALSGLYPLQVGTSRYALSAPHVPLTRWRLPGGDLVIRAYGDGDVIQRVSVNGEDWQRSWIDHADLVGGCEIAVWLGTTPTGWASEVGDSAPSLTGWGERPRPWRDLSGTGTLSGTPSAPALAALVDDVGDTPVPLHPGDEVTWTIDGHERVEAYTVTLAEPTGDTPLAWRVETRDHDGSWWVADRRSDESFEWPGQLRPFLLDEPTATTGLRLIVEAGSFSCLQLEALGR